MSFLQGLLLYKWVIIFYGAIILLLYIYRKRFESQGKLIKLYKTKVGIQYMDKIVQRRKASHVKIGETILNLAFPVIIVFSLLIIPHLAKWVTYPQDFTQAIIIIIFVAIIAYIIGLFFRPIEKAALHGVYVGYAGMLLIVIFVIYGLYQVLFVPNAPPPIQPVIPGVPIPGAPIQVPLIIGWIALFISAVVHEFSHGVVSRAYGIKVKSSGFAFIGPLAAAFVEPDENQVKRARKKVQNSIFAAGPFSNVILAFLMLIVLTFALTPAIDAYLVPEGVRFASVQPGYPAAGAGVKGGIVYTRLNGDNVTSMPEFFTALENLTPNETVTIGNDREFHTIVATVHPQNASKGYLGVIGPETAFRNEHSVLGEVLVWLARLLNWIFIISLGLGLANLLPLGPVDGGRLFQTASLNAFGKKNGKKIWGVVTIAFIIIIILLFLPIFKQIGISILKALHIL